MAKVSPGITSFNAGELSPLMDARSDFAKYASGCKRLENFIPLVQGPAMRRAGTKFVEYASHKDNRSFFVRFMFSATEVYVLEFGNNVVRLFTDRGYIVPPDYDNATAYSVGQYVTYLAETYHCKATTTGNLPTNATYWRKCGTYSSPTSVVPDLYTGMGGTANLGDENGCKLRFAQSGDVIYVTNTNGNWPPFKITRYSDSWWTIAQLYDYSGTFINWTTADGPFDDENTDTGNLIHCRVITTQEVGATVDLVSDTAGTFTNLAGSLFRLSEVDLNTIQQWQAGVAVVANDVRRYNGVNYKALNNATTGTTPPTHRYGAQYDGAVRWQYLDNGDGVVEIQSEFNSGITSTKTITGAANNGAGLVRITANGHGFETGYYVTVAGVTGTTEANGSWYITKITANTFDLIGSAFVNPYVNGGTAKVFAGQIATGIVRSRIPDTACGYTNATFHWAYGAFSYTDWPEHVAFFRERLAFIKGQTAYLSVAGDFENFATKDELGLIVKDRALTATIVADQADAVQWVAPTSAGLMIGTSGNEMMLTELTTSEAFGPGNAQVIPQTASGSRGVPAVRVGDQVFFAQRAGRKLRMLASSADGVRSVDLSALNQEILSGGITSMAWQSEPYQMLWVVTGNGELVSLTYNTEQEVVAWARHPIGGVFGSGDAVVEDVCCIPSPTNDRDDVYLVVKRTINGATARYIEVMVPEVQTGDDFDSPHYLDSHLLYDSTATATITGLSHLEGQTVSVLADGYVHPDCTVSGGSITLNYSASVVTVGLPYDSVLQTMRIEAGAQDGTAQGKIKRINSLVVRLYNTLGGFVGPDEDNLDELQFGNPPTEWFTGDKRVQFPAAFTRDGYVMVKQTQPLPMTVVGLFPQMTTQDGG